MISPFDEEFIQYDRHAKYYQMHELHDMIEHVYQLADDWATQFKHQSLSAFLNKQGIIVKCFDGVSDVLPYRALFKQEDNHYLILVNQLSIKAMEEQTGASPEDIYLLHVYHELFHYLEVQHGHAYDSVQSKKIRFRTKKLMKLSEIGAFRFSQTLSNVPFHPFSLDQ